MKFGKAFSDSLVAQRSIKRTVREEGPAWWRGAGRALLFGSITCVAFFVLVIRLFHLTTIRGHELRTLADGNRIRELIRHAPRGILFDRTGKPLVVNIAGYRLIRPCEGETDTQCVEWISPEEGLPAGTFIEVDWRRQYPYGMALSHLIGYSGELSAEELGQAYYRDRQYGRGDRIGRAGAEQVFEEKLRGRNGKELVEVDAQGKILRVLGRDPEVAGESVSLAVDAQLSRVAEQSFPQGFKGAIVVSKPTTGEILVLYSSPSFDPANISSSLLSDPDAPLFFRAIGGGYPPGSTFKLVTATAALEEGAVKKDTVVEDTGVITVGPFTFPNWYFNQYGKTEGVVDVVRAIARSNDIFFYKAGEWLGITKLADWAHRMGVGQPLGIELDGEAGGLMPDPPWKNSYFSSPEDLEGRNNEWYLGDTYHVAIGQGYLLVSPLQVNAWTNVIANRGWLCQPTIRKVQSAIRQLADKVQNCKNLNLKEETINLITQGMRKSCEPGGTGWPLFDFSVIPGSTRNPSAVSITGSRLMGRDDKVVIPVACKTGTAEFGPSSLRSSGQARTHAWFTVFAPVEEPEISVTVLVEGGGEGSNVAAPIAKKILAAWFSR